MPGLQERLSVLADGDPTALFARVAFDDIVALIPDTLFPISFVALNGGDLGRLVSREPHDGRAAWEYLDESQAGEQAASPRVRLVMSPHTRGLLTGIHRGWGEHLRLGTNLIIDHFLQDAAWSQEVLGVLRDAGARTLLVGVFCSVPELERRESSRADGQGEGRPARAGAPQQRTVSWAWPGLRRSYPDRSADHRRVGGRDHRRTACREPAQSPVMARRWGLLAVHFCADAQAHGAGTGRDFRRRTRLCRRRAAVYRRRGASRGRFHHLPGAGLRQPTIWPIPAVLVDAIGPVRSWLVVGESGPAQRLGVALVAVPYLRPGLPSVRGCGRGVGRRGCGVARADAAPVPRRVLGSGSGGGAGGGLRRADGGSTRGSGGSGGVVRVWPSRRRGRRGGVAGGRMPVRAGA